MNRKADEVLGEEPHFSFQERGATYAEKGWT